MKRTPLSILLLTLGVAGALASVEALATVPPGGDSEHGAAPKAQPRMTIAAALRRAAVADPNLDGEVTSVEAARYYETRFRLLDADRDGWIDRSEFLRTAVVRSVVAGDSFSPPQRPHEFESIDLDGDGSLTPEEFLRAALMGRTSSIAGEVGGPRQAIFEVVDSDWDGVLSKREFMKAGARDFDRSDADGDGKVTIWEFYRGTSL
jgi:hypothetical protein